MDGDHGRVTRRRVGGPHACAGTPRLLAPLVPIALAVVLALAVALPADALAAPTIERLAGPTRVQTALAVSKRLHPSGADAVVLATGDAFPDALTGGPLAHLVGGPLLLVSGDGLGADVAAEVRRLAPERVFVLGGPGAVSASVVEALEGLGVGEVFRLGGPTRFETAEAIADRMRIEGAESGRAVVVAGNAWPDAASAGPLAAVLGCPIVLADDGELPAASRATLDEWGTERAVVVGGEGVVPDTVLAELPSPERLGGADRYATSRLVARRGLALGLTEGTIVAATGDTFPDALAGAPLAADARAPILLTRGDSLSPSAADFIGDHASATERVVLLGGTGAISPSVESAIRALLGLTAAGDWPDTSTRVEVFSDQVSESITDAQLAFVAERYAGSQKQTRSFARRLRAVDPGYLVIHYRLGLGLGYRSGGEWIRIIEGDEWVREWPDSPDDDWFYLYGGERVLHTGWGWYLIDVDDAGWRSWWTAEVERQIAANESDGLFIDSYSVPNYLGGSVYSPALPAYDLAFEAEWTARIDRYSTYLVGRPALRPIIANAGSWVTSRDEVDYSVLDGVMIEGLGQWAPGTPFSEGDWALQQDRILSLAREGRVVLGQAYLDSAADMRTRRMVAGSYLISKGSRSYLCLEMGYEPEWFPEYDLDLGAPVDALPASVDELRLASGLYVRRFERGVVLVNPTGSAIEVAVADAAGGGSWDRAGFVGGGVLPADADVSGMRITRTPIVDVTVPAHDAAFLLAR